MNEDSMRLQRFLARAGIASRRGAEKLIAQGRVAVNGNTVTTLGTKVSPNADSVQVDGKRVTIPTESCTLVLNKPKGYVSTMSDPHAKLTVKSLIPTDDWPSLYPVGRLDADTEGLLVFTTDGDLGQHLLHPSHHVEKTYVAKVEGVPSNAQLQRLRDGVELEDGMTAPAKVKLLEKTTDYSTIEIVIHEGRNRQVRRMFKAVGHPVKELKRTWFGNICLQGIDCGEYKILSQDEVDSLLNL